MWRHESLSSVYAEAEHRLAVGALVGHGIGAALGIGNGIRVGAGDTVGVGVARQTPSSAYRLATSAASSARLQICIDLMAPWK